MKILILASAPEQDYTYVKQLAQQADYIICADGGLRHARACEIQPDLVIGDFDSGNAPEDISVIRLKPEKDDSDLMCCTKEALKHDPDEIVYACASGGRLDHFLSNLSLLEYTAEHHCQAVLYDAQNRVSFHAGGTKYYQRDTQYPYVSIIPLDAVLTGVTLRGLKYQLTDAAVYRSQMITISNEAVEDKYMISIAEGRSLVIESRDRT